MCHVTDFETVHDDREKETVELNKMTMKIRLNKQIISIALPVMVQNLAFYAMQFTNTAFIGHYKIEGLSAINNAMIPFHMFFSFFIALSQGTTIMIAQAIGAKDYKRASHVAETSLYYNQIISFGYFLFWLLGGKYVLILMGVEGEILKMGTIYVQVLSGVFLTTGMNLTASAIYQGIGRTTPIMVNNIIRSLVNIVLDYLLIFGKFGFPELGITGAALATLISSTINNVSLAERSLKNGVIEVTLRGALRPVKGVYRKVFMFGSQAGMEFMLFMGAQVVLIRMLNTTDPLSAGLYGIINTLLNLSVNIYLGVGVAATTLVGRATGAREHRQALSIGNRCVLYALVVCTAIGLLFVTAPSGILHLFSSDEKILAQLSPLLMIMVLISFPKSVNIVAGNSIRGTGDARWMLITQFIGTIMIIAVSAHMIFVVKMGLAGLLLANFADEFWRSIVNYGRFIIGGKRLASRDPLPCSATITDNVRV